MPSGVGAHHSPVKDGVFDEAVAGHQGVAYAGVADHSARTEGHVRTDHGAFEHDAACGRAESAAWSNVRDCLDAYEQRLSARGGEPASATPEFAVLRRHGPVLLANFRASIATGPR